MINQEEFKKLSTNLTTNRNDYMSAFRKNIDYYMDYGGITLKELSEMSHVPYSTLNSFLYNQQNDIRLSTVIKLATFLGVSIDELVGAETIQEATRESMKLCRKLPEHDLYLVRWFIKYLDRANKECAPNKRFLSVMKLECNGNGNLKITSDYVKLDITNLDPEIKGKVFFGITMPCEHYMPIYSPYDVLLIANDRFPRKTENCLIQVNKILHIAKRITENGLIKYYSIRDGKYRIDEKDVDDLIGYVAGTVKCI